MLLPTGRLRAPPCPSVLAARPGRCRKPLHATTRQRRPGGGARAAGRGGGGSDGGGNKNGGGGGVRIDNPELVVGDCVALVAFALWKQISAIVLSPDFPGWLAPLSFDPLRLLEWLSFATTLVSAWCVAGLLTGAFQASATRALRPALEAVSRAWLVSMPVAAAQLVLVTAAESGALVGEPGFSRRLPLAASLPGEPFGTAAGVLGVLAMWRCFYCVYLDLWRLLPGDERPDADMVEEAARLHEAITAVALLAAVGSVTMQVLQVLWGDHPYLD